MANAADIIFGGSSLSPGELTLAFAIPKAFGFIVLIVILSVILLLWLGIQVGRARTMYKVDYPTMYSPDNDNFNCYQRAHQNTMEWYPMFIILLVLGGLEMPLFSAVGGLIWIIGRGLYARGYYTGEPKNRVVGVIVGHIGMLFLLAATIKFGVRFAMLS